MDDQDMVKKLPLRCGIGIDAFPTRGVHLIRRDHPELSLRLFVYQPRKAIDQLHVIYDSDFLGGSDMILSSKHRLYKVISLGLL